MKKRNQQGIYVLGWTIDESTWGKYLSIYDVASRFMWDALMANPGKYDVFYFEFRTSAEYHRENRAYASISL